MNQADYATPAEIEKIWCLHRQGVEAEFIAERLQRTKRSVFNILQRRRNLALQNGESTSIEFSGWDWSMDGFQRFL